MLDATPEKQDTQALVSSELFEAGAGSTVLDGLEGFEDADAIPERSMT